VNTKLQSIIFAGTSRLTDISPVIGGRLLDSTIRPLYGSRTLSAVFEHGSRKVMKGMKAFRRFLVIPDIHIGDAVMMQSSLIALRDFFPDAEIDYVVNKTAGPLIEGNPDATRIIPVFSDGQFPSSTDVEALQGVIRRGQYDLCVNICPFLEKRDIAGNGQSVARFLNRAPILLRNENDSVHINHFSYQSYQFVRGLLLMAAQPVREDCFVGVRTTYSDEAIESACRFTMEAGLSSRAPVIMFNPDSSSRFNLMPFASQARLLGLLAAEITAETTILLGAGHTEAGIGERLADSIPSTLRSKVRIVPRTVPLDVFSALIDFADVFVSGDTGPLHLAAARRYSRSGHYQFRNRTAVLSFFGATTPRMSGYDSFQPGYLPANQDAPSWCYQAGSPCRNITCLNKMFKTCKTVRCFEHVDVAGLSTLIAGYLNGLGRHAAA
jgi:ADP-heptose:LPS heptosyltransferase